jgi:hypothetical protein
MENAPKTSIRQLSQQINLSLRTTHTTIHKNLHTRIYPYRVTAMQELKPADYPIIHITSLQLACRKRRQ